MGRCSTQLKQSSVTRNVHAYHALELGWSVYRLELGSGSRTVRRQAHPEDLRRLASPNLSLPVHHRSGAALVIIGLGILFPMLMAAHGNQARLWPWLMG